MPTSLTRPSRVVPFALLRAGLALGLALPLLATTCELTLGPSRREAGTYVLVSVDGWPLPFTLHHDPHETRTIRAETIELDGRGRAVRWTLVEHFRHGHDLTSRSRSVMEYRLDGDVIVLGTFGSCLPSEPCTGSETGTLRGDELVLTSGWFGARRRYLRVSD